MVAGCRFEFAELHDAAVAMDAPPLALACNTPVRLTDGAGGELAATATTTRIVAAWIDASGLGHSAGARIAGQIATPFELGAEPFAVAHVGIAADAKGNAILGVATDAAGSTSLRIMDDATLTLGATFQSTIGLTGAHGVAATGLDMPAWAIAGNDAGAGRELAVGVTYSGTIGPTLDSGNLSSRSTLVPFDTRIAIVDHAVGDTCNIKTMTAAITSHVGSTGWGTAGQCTQATAVFSPGRADALLVRHDLTDNDLNHVIATVNSTGTLTIPGESRLRSPANEARGIGASDGYWALYETAGALEVVHVDFAGTVGTPLVLAQVSSATGHDLVRFAGEPYAIWLGDGLELARICP